MTPFQAGMYFDDDGRYHRSGIPGVGGAPDPAGDGWHYDRRFPGKKMQSFNSMTEASAFIRSNKGTG